MVCQARFKECENQIKHIIEGIDFVIPIENLKLFTWDEIDQRACGDKIVDLEKLKKITTYSVLIYYLTYFIEYQCGGSSNGAVLEGS